MEHLALMARFNKWVNGHFFDQVARLPDAEYRRDRGAFFGSIHNTLNHILLVDELWRARIEDEPVRHESLRDILHDDFEALRAARVVEDERLIGLVHELSAEDLKRTFTYTSLSGGTLHQARVDQVLITLFNHQTHHRGQVHAMLTQAGVFPPDLDVVDYLDDIQKPGPEVPGPGIRDQGDS